VSTLRTPFLVDVPAAEPREAESRHGAGIVTRRYRLDDDEDLDDLDDDDEFDEDEENDDDEEEDDGDEPEPWQVARG
jgi:hypothetical protein